MCNHGWCKLLLVTCKLLVTTSYYSESFHSDGFWDFCGLSQFVSSSVHVAVCISNGFQRSVTTGTTHDPVLRESPSSSCPFCNDRVAAGDWVESGQHDIDSSLINQVWVSNSQDLENRNAFQSIFCYICCYVQHPWKIRDDFTTVNTGTLEAWSAK